MYSRGRNKANNILTLVISAILMQLVFSTLATATEWRATSVVSVRTEYNDNRRLTPGEQESVVGQLLTLKSNMRYETEISETKITPRITIDRYNKDTALNSENLYLDMSTSYLAESSRFTLSGNYTRNTTLAAELNDTTGTSTNASQDRDRIQWYIEPQWISELSERSMLTLSLRHLDLSYENTTATNLAEYTVDTLNATISYSLSENTSLKSTLYSTRLKAPPAVNTPVLGKASIDNVTDTIGLSVGFDYEQQRDLTFGIQIGVQKIDTYIESNSVGILAGNEVAVKSIIDDSNDGFTIDMNMVKKLEYTRWTVNLSHSAIPSSQGRLVEQNKIVIRNSYEISPRINSNISVTSLNNSEIQDETSQNRDYQSISASLNWRPTPGWRWYGAIIHSTNEYEINSTAATSNAVQFTLVYTGFNQ